MHFSKPRAPTTAGAVSRIRAFRKAASLPPSRLAALAGVDESVTRNLDSDDWNPTLRTLRKLESIIPATWCPGDAVPARAA